MSNELVTTDTIIGFLQEKVENKEPIGPGVWLDAAQKLNVLLGDESDKLYDMQQSVSVLKANLIEQGKSVAQSKIIVEATDQYTSMMKQKSKIERVIEFIRIAKIQARMRDAEFGGM